MLCLALIAPLALTDVPPLGDYPNHLARLMVLTFPDGPLARFYAVHWAVIPDLGIDLAGPPLLRLLPVHAAGRLLLAGIILLPVLGTVAYSRAVFEQRSWWALGCGLVAYNQTLLLGFLNFTAATGLALLLATAWLRWREEHPTATLAAAALGCVGLFFCHLAGVVFFALLIAGHEITWLWRARILGLSSLARRIGLAALVFAGPAALYPLSLFHAEAGPTEFQPFSIKMRQVLAPVTGYDLALDAPTAVALLFIVVMLARMRMLRMPARAAIPLALTLVGFLAAPFAAKGTFHLDTRFIVLAGFLLFAGLMPRPLPRNGGPIIAAVLIALFGARIAALSVAWADHASSIASVRHAIAAIPPGSVVYTAIRPLPRDAGAARLSSGLRTDLHLAALLAIERKAWWPFLFDNESQQPVTTREPFRALAARVGNIPELTGGRLPMDLDLCGFDHLLLQGRLTGFDAARFAGDRLVPLAISDRAASFRVAADHCGAGR